MSLWWMRRFLYVAAIYIPIPPLICNLMWSTPFLNGVGCFPESRKNINNSIPSSHSLQQFLEGPVKCCFPPEDLRCSEHEMSSGDLIALTIVLDTSLVYFPQHWSARTGLPLCSPLSLKHIYKRSLQKHFPKIFSHQTRFPEPCAFRVKPPN